MTRAFTALLASTALIPAAALAQALPSGGHVVAGQASIAGSGSAMTITQGSDRAVINWHDFSVGQGQRVDILQPNSRSALLNRVTGSATSTIAGQISANGQVYLVNPNGILITKTGSINAAGFVASSLDLSDKAFMAGEIVVTGKGGSVVNQGRISIVRGGYAALIGGHVDNAGTILAPLGKVALASGTRATLDLEGDGFLQVALPASDGTVTMAGRIVADGGAVLLTAGQAKDAARGVVNLSGSIEARGVERKGGTVILTGGDITLAGASIDVSGDAGGGSARVGGDWQGGGTLARANTLSADAATSIKADATTQGNGGSIVLWSDQHTNFASTISAHGAGGGNGGDAEVSGKATLAYSGTADLRGAKFGTLLLDPYNLTISNSADTGMAGFDAAGNDSILSTTTLTNTLATANVTVTTGSGGTQAGNITLAAPLGWNSASTLTLNAAGAINLNSEITAAAGGLTLQSGATIGATGDISVARFTLASGNWVQNTATLPAFNTSDFRLTGGSFLRAAGGAGTSASPWMLTDIYGVQGMANLLSKSFILASDIDATGTATWNGGEGYQPIGDDENSFTGNLDGAGHMINGLTINRPTQNYIGLFGGIRLGRVNRLGLTNANIQGNQLVGGLSGYNYGYISEILVSGSISGGDQVGGAVGHNGGEIDNSYSTATVYGIAGGIAGYNGGVIAHSYAAGAVFSGYSGGVVSYNQGTLTAVYWDTTATGQTSATRANGGSSAGATGLTTAQMQDSANFRTTFSGFDFTNIWAPPGASHYPELYALSNVLTVDAGASFYYGDTPVARYSGLHSGDTISTLATISGVSATSPVGSYSATASGAGVTSWTGRTYRYIYLPGTASVTQRPITISAQAKSRDYGSPNPALTYTVGGSGLANGDRLSGLLTTAATVTSNVGSYAITQGSVTVSGGSNYLLSYVGATLTIGQRPITITAYAQSRVYGDANPALTYAVGGSGLANGDKLNGFLTTAATATNNVGSYAITQGTLTEAANPNYRLTYVGNTLTIGRRPVTITADAQSRLYGDANPALTYSNTSLGAGTALIGALASAASPTSNVGAYAIFQGSLTNAANPNYLLSYLGANLAVTRRPVTVIADTRSRVYGEANPVLTYSTTSLGAGIALSGTLATVAGPTSNVGTYAITPGTLTDAANPNYRLSYVGSNLTIGQRPVTITANAQSRVYGDTNPALTYSNSSLGAGVALSGALNTTADPTSNVGAYAIGQGTLTDAANPNYLLTYVGNTLTINQRPVTITADAQGRLYGAANPALTYTTTSLGAGNPIDGWLSTTATASSDVGAYAITLSVLGDPNYTFAYVGANLTVSQRPVTVTANAQNRLYGDTNPALTYGNTSLGAGAALSGALTTDATPTSNVGSYIIGQGTLTSAANPNYLLTYVGNTLTIGQRPVTVTADGQNRLYGAANPALTYTTTSLGAGTTLSGALSTSATPASNVGAYAIGQGTLTSAANPNYLLTYVGNTLTIGQRPVTVTANGQSRLYGDANPALTYTTTSLGAGVALGGALATAATAASNVGGYTISQGTLTAAANPNYLLSYVGNTLTISQRPVTVTALSGQAKVYGNLDPTFAYTIGGLGLVFTDTLSGGLARAAGENVGAYAIGQGSLQASANYALTFIPGATFTITPRPITLIADAQNRIYGDANPALTYTVGGDGLVGSDRLAGGLATSAVLTSDVGAYAIGRGDLAASSNYQIMSYESADLTITPRPIAVVGATGLTRIYDGSTSLPGEATGFSTSGVLFGDAVTVTAGGAAYDMPNAGNRTVLVSGLALGGAKAGNYSLADTTVTGSGTITPAALTISGRRGYDGSTFFDTSTLAVAGAVNGEQVILAAGSGTTAATGAGSYADSPLAGVAIAVSGGNALASNYLLPTTGTLSILGGARLTLTALDRSKVYGDVLALGTTGFSIGGTLATGDSVTGVTLASTGVSASAGVARYTIAISDAVGNGLDNYAIDYVSGTLTVTPRALIVSADPLSRLYGDANPALTYTVGGAGLVNGDTLAGALATDAATTSDIGRYTLGQGTIRASANYDLTYAGADLTITQRPIIITAGPGQSKIYGNSDPALAYAIGGAGLVNGDLLSGSLARASGENVGAYAIMLGSLGAGGNYALSFVPGTTFAIGQRPITITADTLPRLYGDANPVLTYTVGGAGLANGDALAGALATDAGITSNVGRYAIGQGTLGASTNYRVSFIGADLTITPRPITILADDLSRQFGLPTPPLSYAVGGSGLVNGDRLTGALTVAAGEASLPGRYVIGQGSLMASSNYRVHYVEGTMTILPAPSGSMTSGSLGSSVVRDGFASGIRPPVDAARLLPADPSLQAAPFASQTIVPMICPRNLGCTVQ